MNPSTAFAGVMVDELIRGGVQHAVLAPGSRSAPVALALSSAERSGRLRLHVRTDERSAGFLALGLAKGSGRPVPVLTTSGTAAAHLHAAVLEASYSGVPLIALTADRPPEMRGTGANQTIDQVGLYGDAVRFFADVDVPERRTGSNDGWRRVVCTALTRASGVLGGRPGAVHLNLPLRAPLLPGIPESDDQHAAEEPWPESLEGRADGQPWMLTQRPRDDGDVGPRFVHADNGQPTWMVLGDTTAEVSGLAVDVAVRHGWPILAEPTGNAGTSAVPGYLGLLESQSFMARHGPRRVICVGRPTLSRAVQALLADEDVQVDRFAFGPQWTGRSRPIDELRGHDSGRVDAAGGDTGTALVELLATAGEAFADHQDRIVDEAYLGGAKVARDLVRLLPDGSRLFLGSSNPIRDVDRYAAPRDGVQMLGNRGVAGIDGSISTAAGLALAAPGRPTFALIGDLTFLHDLGGLMIPDSEARPDLRIVVVDNRGGGIFAQLEPGRPEYEQDYERVFGTPHSLDLVLVARSLGWPAEEVTRAGQLPAALQRHGPQVIVVRTNQRADAEVLRRVRNVPENLLDQ
ncbi:MAG: 2-succinyl-5-enolpyruvyl-6-hydroxy-3-cyclohexene-1-carboxylic-acid synthase [Actinomycetota bacterium]|nr:2-succinyl-5-enolpyruvyl-6-hydroxy-3-cyclohexene-1-carboxylic-acid synthase [Actinomycetota bacterium]